MIPSNIPGQSRWTSHKHRRMSHRRSVFHCSSMSRNQSRAMGSTWTLRRFEPLPLGSSSTSAAAARGVLVVATRLGAASGPCGSSWCSRMWSCRALSQSCCPAGASGGPPPLDWWPTQTNRQGDGGPLGPHVVERGGIQTE